MLLMAGAIHDKNEYKEENDLLVSSKVILNWKVALISLFSSNDVKICQLKEGSH